MFMEFIVDRNGDTVYIDHLDPVYKVARRKGKEWRKYYRLVHNFSKTYPYALVARRLVEETDSTIAAEKMNRRERERAISSWLLDMGW